MDRYTGATCPVCQRRFVDGDDIVVCPDCGTPHHRACWAVEQKCANEALHAENYTFPLPDQNQRCPQCGTPFSEGEKHCGNCGAALEKPQLTLEQMVPEATVLSAPGAPVQVMVHSPGGTAQIDGIPLQDWVTYIGPSAGYYLFHFARMDATGTKLGFTPTALFFPALFFFFRKMWFVGFLSMVTNALLNAPQFFIAMRDAGYVIPPLAQQYMPLLTQLAGPFSVANMVLHMLWAVFAVYLYRRHATQKLRQLRSAHPAEGDYQQALVRAAGPSKEAMLLFAAMIGVFLLVQLYFLTK